MLGENITLLIIEARKLREHSHEMEMATHYKKFNYSFLDKLIIQAIEIQATDEERALLRPLENIRAKGIEK